MSGLGWYVVQAHPRKEAFVRDRIEDLGREVFYPLLAERRLGRRRATVGPLFPGYLFARLNRSAGDLPRVRWMHGVNRILGEGCRARAIGDHVVHEIRSRTDGQGRVCLGIRLKRGERVRILNGPLAGLVGLLERPASSTEERVSVLVELFQRVTQVNLRTDEIGGVNAA
jgi:transcriptional antiterminator RfaH